MSGAPQTTLMHAIDHHELHRVALGLEMDKDVGHLFLWFLEHASWPFGVLQHLNRAGESLADARRLTRFGDETWKPAERAWREFRRGREPDPEDARHFRQLRARLGGSSRWLYAHQKKVFLDTLGMLCPVPLTRWLQDRLWAAVQLAERRRLANWRRSRD